MKKEYVKPAMIAVDCQSQGLLADSVRVSSAKRTNNAYSQEWEEDSKGFDW